MRRFRNCVLAPAAEAPAESVPLMVKLITAGAKVPECRATIEMKPMVTAAPVDAA